MATILYRTHEGKVEEARVEASRVSSMLESGWRVTEHEDHSEEVVEVSVSDLIEIASKDFLSDVIVDYLGLELPKRIDSMRNLVATAAGDDTDLADYIVEKLNDIKD